MRRRIPEGPRRRLGTGEVQAGRYLKTLLGWFTEALADWSEQDRRSLVRLLV
ncbi:hypothetical protein [Amycolatopsis taiwanensis]|uniref:hypothetical protein n=1 Tax=Amycolatopsis taiwanensis TaxID=342230 RepID=UPI0004B03D78|nr:hypothetical protein [Amycolatopsis taiwanensis]